MSDAQALALADRSLADGLLHFNRHAPGAAAEEAGGLLLFAGSHPYPGAYCNGLLRLGAEPGAEAVVDRARAFFAPRRRGFVAWARDHGDADLRELAQRERWFARPPEDGMPLMVLDDPRPARRPGEGVTLEAIETEAQARDYLRIVGDAYGMGDAPESLLEAIFFTPGAVLAPEGEAVLARLDGRAVGGIMAVVAGGVAGLYWLGVRPEARGHGIGPTCFGDILARCAARGAELVVAQASQQGVPIHLQAGMRELSRYRRFLAPPPRRA